MMLFTGMIALGALVHVGVAEPIPLTPTPTLSVAPTGTVPAGYLQASGSSIVDNSGHAVTLRGVNLGGWLVIEDWMCGITDTTDDSGPHPYRQSLKTLTARFGAANASTLVQTWEQNFITAQDFVNIKNLGFNLVRLPFSYLTVQNSDGSFRSDAFTMLDFAIQQAKANGIYVILCFHIWETQADDYGLISENSDAGAAAREEAQNVWEFVTNHYLGEGTIAAFDVINEPVGSANNYLQRALYSAVRSVDPNRIIMLEAYGGLPSTYDWHQVAYSFHEYKMQGSDLSANEAVWADNKTTIEKYLSIPVPFYLGEFMASNDTLTYLLQQVDGLGIAWSMWTYKAVNEGGWAFYNYLNSPTSVTVNINTDSFMSILNTWQSLSQVQAKPNTALMNLYSGFT